MQPGEMLAQDAKTAVPVYKTHADYLSEATATLHKQPSLTSHARPLYVSTNKAWRRCCCLNLLSIYASRWDLRPPHLKQAFVFSTHPAHHLYQAWQSNRRIT
jgi:hypothetical protein